MPLTKSQRHTAYIIMRAELRRGESTGEVVWRIWYGSVDYEELIELDNRVMLYPSMWISHATRLRILDECIKKTY